MRDSRSGEAPLIYKLDEDGESGPVAVPGAGRTLSEVIGGDDGVHDPKAKRAGSGESWSDALADFRQATAKRDARLAAAKAEVGPGTYYFEGGDEGWDEEEGERNEGEDWDEDSSSGRPVRDRGIPYEMRCFDTAKIFIKAGDGGRGTVAFRREKFVAQGGPAGGNGGNGGDVYFVADESINSLARFRKKVHHRAPDGKPGGGSKMHGRDAQCIEVKVPPGTVVRNPDGEVIAELLGHGHREMVLPGGRGGRGNASFKTAKNKAPQIAENGEEGLEMWVELELKVVADVGIIGVPNAGKSTLLSTVSAAKPKIADYPFTTIVPNLGVVEREWKRMVFADIPGLLEGASEGIGLGFEFLRHTKRTRVLVHVLDCTSPDVHDEYDAICNELLLFDMSMKDKPHVVALNKIDDPEATERAIELEERFRDEGTPVHLISALTGEGVEDLLAEVRAMLDELPEVDYTAVAEAAATKRVKRAADGQDLVDFQIVDTPYAFVVDGAAIERFAQMTNWDYFESYKRFARVLKMSGLEKALDEAGAGEGDRVMIGKYEFEWSRDRREKVMYDTWKAAQDEKPGARQGSRHWPH